MRVHAPAPDHQHPVQKKEEEEALQYPVMAPPPLQFAGAGDDAEEGGDEVLGPVGADQRGASGASGSGGNTRAAPRNDLVVSPIAVDPTELMTARFKPSEAVAAAIVSGGASGADIPVTFGNIASGTIRVKRDKVGHYRTADRKFCKLSLNLPLLQPLRDAGIDPVLLIELRETGVIGGFATLFSGGKVMDHNAIAGWITENSEKMALGSIGEIGAPASITNEIEGGRFTFSLNEIPAKLAGYLDVTLSFGCVNEILTFIARGQVDVPGVTSGTLEIQRDKKGLLSGAVELPVTVGDFSGAIKAEYKNGQLNMQGTARVDTPKLSGEVNLLVTDEQTARNVAYSQLNPQQLSEEAAKSQQQKPEMPATPGPRALAGWGELEVRVADWLSGKAKVIMDGRGHVTVVGSIEPPSEIELFKEKEVKHRMPDVEVRAVYGVPLVGNLFIFAGVGLELLAKLGPGKIYDIVMEGTWSTDPEVKNAFEVAASLNISAFAGARLRARGGAGIELADHDLKAGVQITALAGVRGYVDARPTIGYREGKDNKDDEFYLKGHMEVAGQPYFALGGDLFVELDAPWWSPAPDATWEWPIGRLEYPLPGGFGLGADVEHVIGSGEVPEVKWGEVNFSADKFMDDLMADEVAKGGNGGTKKGKAGYKDGVEKKKKQDPKLATGKGGKGKGTKGVKGNAEDLKRQKGMAEKDPEAKSKGKKDKKKLKDEQGKGKKQRKGERTMQEKQMDLDAAINEARTYLMAQDEISMEEVERKLEKLKRKYRMKYLRLNVKKDLGREELVELRGKVNPDNDKDKKEFKMNLDDEQRAEGSGTVPEETIASVMKLVKAKGREDEFLVLYKPPEIEAIVYAGLERKLNEAQIADFIFLGSRKLKDKRIGWRKLIDQMKNYKHVVEERKFPYLFKDEKAFESFKNKVKGAMSDLKVPVRDMRIQGSSLRTPEARDIDVLIVISEEDFEELATHFRRANKKETRDYEEGRRYEESLKRQEKEGWYSPGYMNGRPMNPGARGNKRQSLGDRLSAIVDKIEWAKRPTDIEISIKPPSKQLSVSLFLDF